MAGDAHSDAGSCDPDGYGIFNMPEYIDVYHLTGFLLGIIGLSLAFEVGLHRVHSAVSEQQQLLLDKLKDELMLVGLVSFLLILTSEVVEWSRFHRPPQQPHTRALLHTPRRCALTATRSTTATSAPAGRSHENHLLMEWAHLLLFVWALVMICAALVCMLAEASMRRGWEAQDAADSIFDVNSAAQASHGVTDVVTDDVAF